MAKSLTLAQAVNRQKRLEKQLSKIKAQLAVSVRSFDNRPPKTNPDNLIKLANRLVSDIAKLKNRIQSTYNQALLANGMPLWYALIKQRELQDIQAITREYEWQERSLSISPLTLQRFDNIFEALFQECFEKEFFDNYYQSEDENSRELDYLSQLIEQGLEEAILIE